MTMPDLGTIRRARWVQNSPNTFILKSCAKDGGAALAQVTVYHFFLYHWSLYESDIGGKARSYHAALRRARKAVQEHAHA
jgi:hypothetical protein